MRQNKNAAIVTGASSGIGMEISRKLSDLGYRVYGFGRDFTKTEELAENIIPVAMDLNQTEKLLNKIEEIKKQEQIQLLVNAAGVGYFGLHEESVRSRPVGSQCTST